MSPGNGRVANQLPTDRASLGWRLATGTLKGGGCQARRRPPTWQRAGCQAVANRRDTMTESCRRSRISLRGQMAVKFMELRS